jgi:transglutaminase-like putative cysteine protease
MPAAAALSCILAGTAITGTVAGFGWMSYVVVVVVVMAGTGTLLRALHTPRSVIWVGQLSVLLCLAVTLFTNSGVLVVLPGPTSLSDLGSVLVQAHEDVQSGVPPVAADQAILCLVLLAMGLVAVAVDTLVVTARVPAVSGLVLLCVYAVPASLDDAALPWWSFVLGAAAFTFMLAVDGVQRHQQWRGKLGLPAVATTGVAPATIAITAVGVVVALFIGGTFTLIGTVGRLPGGGSGGAGTGQLGIKPFTVLSGFLDQKNTTELFDVTGLPATPPYLQALTLDDYQPNKGWVRGTTMPPGVQADARLPLAPGQQPNDKTSKVTIQPVNWSDVWLPVYGMPVGLSGISSDYRYDKDSGIVYSEAARKPDGYTEQADLTVPTQAQLRDAGTDYSQVARKYTQIKGVSPQVENLARNITSSASNEFDMAQDVYNYFRDGKNGFTYSTQTAPAVTGDALVDFLFHGKTGFCEQYASAMAVMLRALNLPTRVAIGFTDGFPSNGHQVITTQDAHAWVEVYFPGYGWITFDPTPLTDGRAQVPGFNNSAANPNSANTSGRQNLGSPDNTITKSPKVPSKLTQPEAGSPAPVVVRRSGLPVWQLFTILGLLVVAGASTALARRRPALARYTGWLAGIGWSLLVFFAAALYSWWLAVLIVVLGLAVAPSVVREWRRRRHHRTVVSRGPHAADAAWDELLAESWDRGTEVQRSDTLRVAAQRMARQHGLDRDGQDSLRTLVGEVERSWYGAPPAVDDDTPPTAPVVVESYQQVRTSLRQNAPLTWRARLLPRSVLRPAKDRSQDREDQETE